MGDEEFNRLRVFSVGDGCVSRATCVEGGNAERGMPESSVRNVD